MLILDASGALAWVFERTNRVEAERARLVLARLDELQPIVPSLWHVEVLNSLVTAHRRRILSISRATDFLSRLDRLPIATDVASVSERKPQIFALAREHGLTAYDATYLELALRLGAALFTFDGKLMRAQAKAGVPAP